MTSTECKVTHDDVIDMLSQVPWGNTADRISSLSLEPGEVSLRLGVDDTQDLRPGGTVGGPTMFALADLTMWILVASTRGTAASSLAVTTNATVDFLRKPAPDQALIAHGEVCLFGCVSVVRCGVNIFLFAC